MSKHLNPHEEQAFMIEKTKLYISKYPNSSQQVLRWMQRKHKEWGFQFDTNTLSHLLDDLVQSGWLNDKNYAESMVQYYRNRGKSARYIRHILSQKGIAKSTIEEQTYDKTFELEAAKKRAIVLLKRQKNQDTQKILQKLHHSGFGYDTSITALKAVLLQNEE